MAGVEGPHEVGRRGGLRGHLGGVGWPIEGCRDRGVQEPGGRAERNRHPQRLEAWRAPDLREGGQGELAHQGRLQGRLQRRLEGRLEGQGQGQGRAARRTRRQGPAPVRGQPAVPHVLAGPQGRVQGARAGDPRRHRGGLGREVEGVRHGLVRDRGPGPGRDRQVKREGLPGPQSHGPNGDVWLRAAWPPRRVCSPRSGDGR
mmetsp:Transcript_68106/g.183948  ORF Transcript_68106/g.183948 Transcript_68106/m.183948 type:complete len:202 (-) Transcript_68106:209-814(-)